MYDMINIFEVFLPQLLRYPNPTDPLNGEAAALLMRDAKTYDIKVKGISTQLLQNCKERLLAKRFLQNTSLNMRLRMQRTKPERMKIPRAR